MSHPDTTFMGLPPGHLQLQCAWCAAHRAEESLHRVPPGQMPRSEPPVTLVAGTLLCAMHALYAIKAGAVPLNYQ